MKSTEELETELAQVLTLHNKEVRVYLFLLLAHTKSNWSSFHAPFNSLQSSELHCQISELMGQLEQGQTEREELETKLNHTTMLREQAQAQQDREKLLMKALCRSEFQ